MAVVLNQTRSISSPATSRATNAPPAHLLEAPQHHVVQSQRTLPVCGCDGGGGTWPSAKRRPAGSRWQQARQLRTPAPPCAPDASAPPPPLSSIFTATCVSRHTAK
jgi:hypothetical protein